MLCVNQRLRAAKARPHREDPDPVEEKADMPAAHAG
jgi:hypothetical protein